MVLLVALLASGWLQGCSEPALDPPRAATVVRHVDFLIEDRLTSTVGSQLTESGLAGHGAMEEAFCADEHRWSRRVSDDEELSSLVDLGEGGSLTVGGCIDRPVSRERQGGFTEPRALEISLSPVLGPGVSPDGGAPELRQSLELPTYSGRWRREIDLSSLPPGPVRLRLRVELPTGRELYLQDLSLRHREPAPAPRSAKSARGSQAAPPPGKARQILLISVDTLRDDALSALGGPWPTPRLDRFASSAQIWAPHYAAASWTKPSHASLLTGQSSLVHGAGKAETAIHPGVPLLSERFRRGGFLTKGLAFDCTWLRPKFGFSRGFDEYRVVPWTLPQMVRHSVDWMAEHRDQPFFFFFHTFDVHSDFHRLPYEAPGVRLATVKESFGVPGYGCREQACASNLLEALDAGRIQPLPREEEILRFLYGQGVAHLDESLGLLFAELEEYGLLDSMLIVFTSDHGESLFEHGRLLHGNPWNEVIRVPLLIKWPGGAFAGDRQVAPSSALDVAPTLLAAAGLSTEGLPGEDLRNLSAPRPIFAWGNWRMVATPGWKAVFDYRDEDLLFDLANDAAEMENLAAREPDRLARMRRLAEARRESDSRFAGELHHLTEAEATRPLSEEESRRLKALGYLGSS